MHRCDDFISIQLSQILNVCVPTLCHVHLQIWLSPWQVAHGLAVAAVLEDTLPRPSESLNTAGSVIEGIVEDAVPAALVMTEVEAMRRRMQLTLSAEIPVLSIICFVRLRPSLQPTSSLSAAATIALTRSRYLSSTA